MYRIILGSILLWIRIKYPLLSILLINPKSQSQSFPFLSKPSVPGNTVLASQPQSPPAFLLTL